MCGRYTLSKLEQLLRQFPGITQLPDELRARFNIAPTQSVPVIANSHADRVGMAHWGLVPSWAKDPSIGNRMINARAETLAEKPAFRSALRRRRCLVPADGFYEWQRHPDGKSKTPMFIRLKSGEPFAFAGLWEVWRDPEAGEGEEPLTSCTIVTTSPNALMEHIHDRMPVILPASAYAAWLDPKERDAADLVGLLKPFPAEQMQAHPVSRRVNTPANDDRHLIEEVGAETLF
ncbi:MAG TPA: SOS response-associated peptidase [Humisphaera sp.]